MGDGNGKVEQVHTENGCGSRSHLAKMSRAHDAKSMVFRRIYNKFGDEENENGKSHSHLMATPKAANISQIIIVAIEFCILRFCIYSGFECNNNVSAMERRYLFSARHSRSLTLSLFLPISTR